MKLKLMALSLFTGLASLTSIASGAGVNDGSFLSARWGSLKTELDAPVDTNSNGSATGYRVLFIGDSITRHGFNAGTIETLGWDHVAGMAASVETNDYAHLFVAMLQERMPDRIVEIYFHQDGGSGSAAERLSAIGSVLGIEPHLVVVQLGEHEEATAGEASLRSNYSQLIAAFDAQTLPPLLLCTGVWDPAGAGSATSYSGWTATVERIMREECLAKGGVFASVEPYALDPTCSGTGTSAGVRWHPNNKGHLGYATELIAGYDSLIEP